MLGAGRDGVGGWNRVTVCSLLYTRVDGVTLDHTLYLEAAVSMNMCRQGGIR